MWLYIDCKFSKDLKEEFKGLDIPTCSYHLNLVRIDALHNSDFLFPVARKRGLRCIMADANAPRTGSTDSILAINLNLSSLASCRIDEVKFWLKRRRDSLRRLPTKAAFIQR